MIKSLTKIMSNNPFIQLEKCMQKYVNIDYYYPNVINKIKNEICDIISSSKLSKYQQYYIRETFDISKTNISEFVKYYNYLIFNSYIDDKHEIECFFVVLLISLEQYIPDELDFNMLYSNYFNTYNEYGKKINKLPLFNRNYDGDLNCKIPYFLIDKVYKPDKKYKIIYDKYNSLYNSMDKQYFNSKCISQLYYINSYKTPKILIDLPNKISNITINFIVWNHNDVALLNICLDILYDYFVDNNIKESSLVKYFNDIIGKVIKNHSNKKIIHEFIIKLLKFNIHLYDLPIVEYIPYVEPNTSISQQEVLKMKHEMNKYNIVKINNFDKISELLMYFYDEEHYNIMQFFKKYEDTISYSNNMLYIYMYYKYMQKYNIDFNSHNVIYFERNNKHKDPYNSFIYELYFNKPIENEDDMNIVKIINNYIDNILKKYPSAPIENMITENTISDKEIVLTETYPDIVDTNYPDIVDAVYPDINVPYTYVPSN